MIRTVRKHFSVHRRNIQVIAIISVARVIRVKITVACILINTYLLIGSIERDQKLGEYYAKQNDVDDTRDFTDKNVKILPPHVEEVKRLVSL